MDRKNCLTVIMNEEQSLERAINETVALSPYDSNWPKTFVAEQRRLMTLCPCQFVAIEHIGSTAVPGLSAKPIVDMLGGVTSMAVADSLIGPLCESGYGTSAEFNGQLVNSRWLMRWAAGRRTHHLHLVLHGSAEWSKRLLFRDALRSDKLLASRYEEHKRELAKLFEHDREAYTEAKTVFIREAIGNRAA